MCFAQVELLLARAANTLRPVEDEIKLHHVGSQEFLVDVDAKADKPEETKQGKFDTESATGKKQKFRRSFSWDDQATD